MIAKIDTKWRQDLAHGDMCTLAILSQLFVENGSEPVYLPDYTEALEHYAKRHDFYRCVKKLVELGYITKYKEEGKRAAFFEPNQTLLADYIENLEVEQLFKDE